MRAVVNDAPRRCADVNWVVVDDAVVAVDRRDGSVHQLNGATAVVWQLLDGDPLDGVVSEVSEVLGLAPTAVAGDIEVALGQLRAAHLIEG